jgi:hypothetical protein
MGIFDFLGDGDVLGGLGQGLGRAGQDPAVRALIAQLLQGEEEIDQGAPGVGLSAGGPQPSPLALPGPEAQGGIGQFAGSAGGLDAVLGAPNLEAQGPSSGDLALQAQEAGAAAQAQTQADTEAAAEQEARDRLIRELGLDPAIGAALSTTNLAGRATRAERAAVPKPEKEETGPQRRLRLEDEARVAVSEAQADGIQGPRAVFDVAGRLATRVEGFTDAEIRRAASKVVPQAMRKEPKEEKVEPETDVVAEAVASLKTALEGGSISPESVETVVRRNWPDDADEILAALQGG